MIRKGDLLERQTAATPLAGLNRLPTEKMTRLFLSPGPIADPQGRRPDYWRMGRALHAAGFRAGDIVLNCFSYHFTPAGMMFDGAAGAVGCPVIPGGTGQTDSQIQAIGHFRPVGFAGTPDFLKIILDRADETGADVSSIRRGAVGGGALLPPLRKEYDDRGIAVLQSYGTADVGLIAYESEAREGMILDEDVIVEIVRPGTGTPVPDGEVGEVVVTLLDEDYPLLRFATGDLSAMLDGQSPCGRTAPRIKGMARPGRPEDQDPRHVRRPGPDRPGSPRPPGGRPHAPRGRARRTASTPRCCAARRAADRRTSRPRWPSPSAPSASSAPKSSSSSPARCPMTARS